MKKHTLGYLKLLIISSLLIYGNVALCQPPDPPPDPGIGGTGDIPIGGNASVPLDGGTSIILALSGAYGAYRYKKQIKAKEEE